MARAIFESEERSTEAVSIFFHLWSPFELHFLR